MNDLIHDVGLVDEESGLLRPTWSNDREGSGCIAKCLDGFLVLEALLS